MLTESCTEVANYFCCLRCDYSSSRKSSYDKHILSYKHHKLTNNNSKLTKSCKKVAKICEFICNNCNKEYKSRVGLWKHNKNCINNNDNNICDNNKNYENNNIYENNKNYEITNEMIMNILKQNNELQQMILEQNKTIMELSKNNGNNNNTTNSHNKSFNLQFFLNETCKDAMNIMDFVDSIKLQLSDLERIGELGYVEGISNIIVKNLNALDVTQRPVHCTDKKREVLYVKDENKWEKEDDNKAKMHKVVRKVADKNVKLLPKFKEEYPDCSKSTSKYSDQYNKIIVESMGGSGDNDYEKEEKIIKRITKEVFIDKESS